MRDVLLLLLLLFVEDGRFQLLTQNWPKVLQKTAVLDKTEASLAQADNGTMPWVCAYLEAEADGEADGNGGEAVMVDGQQVGSTTSMAYGHTVGKILAFAYVKPEALSATGKVEIMIMNKPRAAKFINDAVYDPENLLPRG